MKRTLAFLFVTSILSSVSVVYAQHAMMDDKELLNKLMF
jgi:cell division protein FtsL